MHQGTACVVSDTAPRNNAGYARCYAYRFGVRIFTRHRLAWIDAHGMLPPPDAPCVLHHCDNPPCENAEHLYAGTKSQNMRDMIARGRYAPRPAARRGEELHNALVTATQVREIRTARARGEPGRSVARRFGISEQAVCSIHKRRTWTHVL